MKHPLRWRHWVLLALFSILAVLLLLIPSRVKMPEQAQTLSRAVGEALVVAVVVALAVEPRLLRYFGNEIVSQTFWNAFYSRAPEAYKEAIKELAGADKFAEHARWKVSLDWANEERSVVSLTVDYTNFLKNYSSKPHALQPYTFVYDSLFSDIPTRSPSLSDDLPGFSVR